MQNLDITGDLWWQCERHCCSSIPSISFSSPLTLLQRFVPRYINSEVVSQYKIFIHLTCDLWRFHGLLHIKIPHLECRWEMLHFLLEWTRMVKKLYVQGLAFLSVEDHLFLMQLQSAQYIHINVTETHNGDPTNVPQSLCKAYKNWCMLHRDYSDLYPGTNCWGNLPWLMEYSEESLDMRMSFMRYMDQCIFKVHCRKILWAQFQHLLELIFNVADSAVENRY